MTARVEAFLDTNVLVYSLVGDEPEKHSVAQTLVARGFETGCFAVSTQVLLELFVTATRKLTQPLSLTDAAALISALSTWPVVPVTSELVQKAVARSIRNRVSVWDACIVEAARVCGCRTVLSEDMAHGQSFEDIVIHDPFRPDAESLD